MAKQKLQTFLGKITVLSDTTVKAKTLRTVGFITRTSSLAYIYTLVQDQIKSGNYRLYTKPVNETVWNETNSMNYAEQLNPNVIYIRNSSCAGGHDLSIAGFNISLLYALDSKCEVNNKSVPAAIGVNNILITDKNKITRITTLLCGDEPYYDKYKFIEKIITPENSNTNTVRNNIAQATAKELYKTAKKIFTRNIIEGNVFDKTCYQQIISKNTVLIIHGIRNDKQRGYRAQINTGATPDNLAGNNTILDITRLSGNDHSVLNHLIVEIMRNFANTITPEPILGKDGNIMYSDYEKVSYDNCEDNIESQTYDEPNENTPDTYDTQVTSDVDSDAPVIDKISENNQKSPREKLRTETDKKMAEQDPAFARALEQYEYILIYKTMTEAVSRLKIKAKTDKTAAKILSETSGTNKATIKDLALMFLEAKSSFVADETVWSDVIDDFLKKSVEIRMSFDELKRRTDCIIATRDHDIIFFVNDNLYVYHTLNYTVDDIVINKANEIEVIERNVKPKFLNRFVFFRDAPSYKGKYSVVYAADYAIATELYGFKHYRDEIGMASYNSVASEGDPNYIASDELKDGCVEIIKLDTYPSQLVDIR